MIKTDNPEINVEERMQRILSEMAQRKAAPCKAESQASVEPPSFAVQPTFQIKTDGQYHVNDLLCYHDQAFVNAAYRIILHRLPDSNGSVHYLSKLRNGCAKVDILGRLRYSKEGRATGAKITGLLLPFLLHQVYRIPVFGRFAQILSAIWHLPHLERNQRTFENHTVSLMEQAQSHFSESRRALNDSLAQLEQSIRQLNEAHDAIFSRIQQRMDDLQNTKAGLDSIEILKCRIQDLQNAKAGLDAIEILKGRIQDLQNAKAGLDSIETLNDRIQVLQNSKVNQSALDEALLPVKVQAHDIKRNLLDQDRRLGLLLEEARKRLPEPISTEQIETMLGEDFHRLDAMYASFEDRFRGTREDIKQRLSIYLPIVLETKACTKETLILDLGCGRGEWLEFLHHEGLAARGVDINRVFLEGCRELGLDVVEQDAVAYLRSLKSNSIGAVTAFHLIEHLPLKTLLALMDETLRVLKPGGIAIFETPNPENLQVGACGFYTDPTHRNPMPPHLTEALMEFRGFVRPAILRLDQEQRRQYAPLMVPNSQPGAASINPMVEVIRDNFYVSPDYAVIAHKA